MNEINVISPYKHNGMWVFDDPRVDLLQEPFVAGADTWIDRVVADIPDADRGFILIFSGSARTVAIGITRRRSISRAGCARRYFDIFPKRRHTFMFRSNRGTDSRVGGAGRLLGTQLFD